MVWKVDLANEKFHVKYFARAQDVKFLRRETFTTTLSSLKEGNKLTVILHQGVLKNLDEAQQVSHYIEGPKNI